MTRKTIVNIAHFIDSLEELMDKCDLNREKIIFHEEKRNEILDSFIKRYVKDKGEAGA